MNKVITGLEVLLETQELVGGRRWALLANHAAVTSDLDPARGALVGAGLGPLIRLFAPEHGLDGVAQDMEAVDDLRDPLTGSTIRSLYDDGPSTFAPRPDDLADLDVLLVDLPDIGSRYYTFAASMDAAMQRTFRLHNPFNLDVRIDATNLLNHASFTMWNSITNSATLGLPAGTHSMRSLQVTARLRF